MITCKCIIILICKIKIYFGVRFLLGLFELLNNMYIHYDGLSLINLL